MADAIRIQVTLDPTDIAAAGQKIARQLQSALDSAANSARATGAKIGDALDSGIQASAQKIEGQIRAIRERAAQGRINDQQKANQKLEQDALKHAAKLEAIALQGTAKLAQQEAKRLADLDAIRERFAQKEIERQRKLNEQAQRNSGTLAFIRRFSSTVREAGESIQQAGQAATRLLTQPLLDLGRAAVKSAIDIDRQVNVLKALTGSTETAEKRFAQLVATASNSPGLTTSLAATLDAQLRVANVGVSTIDKLLPAIGRLNAVSPLGDPSKFAQNLTQLITQGFERADLKELVGQSPLAGEIIKSIFNVDSATNGKAIREAAQKLGITTTDAFFSAFAEAAQNNPKLAGITESLGTQFEKLQDRILVALRPLGLAIVEALKPLADSAAPIIEKLSAAFSALPQGAQQAIIVLGALAAAIGPLVIAFGALIQTAGAIGNLITVISALFTVGGAAASGGVLAGLATTLGGIAAAVPPVAIALGGLALVIGGVVAAYQLFGDTAEQVSNKTRADLVTSQERVKVGQQEVDSLRNLQEQTSLNAAEQSKIKSLYDALDPVQKARVGVYAEESGGVETLTGKLTGLVQVLDETNQKRLEAQRIAASDAGAGIVNDLQINGLRDYSDKIDSLNKQVEDYARKQVEAEKTGERFGRSLAGPGVSAAEVYAQKIREISGELNTTKNAAANNQKQYIALGNAFREAAKASGKTTDEFIKQSIAASGLGGDLVALERRLRQLAGVGASASAPSRAALLAAGAKIADADPAKPKGILGGGGSGGGGSARSAVDNAKQIADALQSQRKAAGEDALRLLKDQNDREISELKRAYDEKTIQADQYYPKVEALTRSTFRAEIELIREQIGTNAEQFLKAKEGSVEKIRLSQEFDHLLTELTLKTRALTDAETANAQAFAESAKAKGVELLKITQSLALPAQENLLPETVDPFSQRARNTITEAQQATIQFRKDDLALQLQEVQIQSAVASGVLTERQGKEATLAVQRQYRDVLIQSLELSKQGGLDPEAIARINIQIEQLRGLGQELSPAQAFFKGLRSEAETTAESFERIGGALKDKFLGVLDSGIDKLTKKFGFFKDLIGDILKSLTRRIVSQLFGGGGAGGGGQAAGGGGGGIGGFLSNIFGKVFGGGNQSAAASGGGSTLANVASAATSGGSNLGSFLTGGFAGGGGANVGSASTGISGILQGVLGGGISAPPSIGGASGAISAAKSALGGGAGGAGGGLKSLFGGLGGGLSGLLKGIGFGKTAGTGGALASALPLLGLSLGAGVGGSSLLGQIIGGAGGLAVGVGLTAAPAALAGSSLGFLAPLFSNPLTAVFGGIALVGAFLLGRAKQRKKDEGTSGDYLQSAIDGIRNIGSGVRDDSIKGTDAKKIFESEVMATFIAQINTIKTKSVRESRLTNQTRDLRALFEKEVGPEIEAQKLRLKNGAFGRNLIPEFATGGVVGGVDLGRDSVLALMRPKEMVLTVDQQARVAQMAGQNVFAMAGVPGAGLAQQPTSVSVQPFATGGIAQPFIVSSGGNSGGSNEPIIVEMVVELNVSEDNAVKILGQAVRGSAGRSVIVKTVRKEKGFGN